MIGRTLRQYRVISQLGQGGMGVVWKARDTILDRDVALKVLPSDGRDADRRKERFFREAKAASALNHPNIITIYEINSDQGVDFIAMEYVQGATLSAVLRRGRVTIDQILRYSVQVAEAVGRAHAAGIVHRDLKPGNIMVTDDGLVKVLDFGLAKVTKPRSTEDGVTRMQLTQAGTPLGTVGYMSPEQAIGDNADARSDVFSFGVILYEMLGGQLPFAAASQSEILRKLHFSEPPSLVSLRPDIPAPVAAIVTRTLAKLPADRYASLADVAAALREIASGVMTKPIAVGASSDALDPARANRPRAWRRGVAAGLAVLVLASVVAVLMWRWRGSPGRSNVASRPAPTEPAGTYELTQQAAALLVRQDKEGNVDNAIALLERALSQDQQSALAYAHLSEAYLRKHQTNPDPQWRKLARETAQHAIEINPDLAAARQALGFVLFEVGERTEAAVEFRRAMDLDPVNPLPHVGLALIFSANNQDGEAEAAFRRAVQLGPQQVRPHNELGDFFFRRARYKEAAVEWEAARTLTPDNVSVLRNLSAAYYSLGQNDEAASILQRALEIKPSAGIYTNLGTIRFFQGRYNDAVVAFEKAVELGANRYLNWGNLGDGLRWAPGRRKESAAAYRRASDLITLQIAEKPGDLDLRTRHALYLMKMGDRAAALKEVEDVATRSTLTAQMQYRLTVVYELAHDRRRALDALDKALKAGYPVRELDNEPELTSLRTDARYHRLIDHARR